MKLTVWDPFREMEDLLDRYSRSTQRNLPQSGGRADFLADWKPTVDIEEKKDEFLIRAELPGVKKEDVSISIEDGVLTIKGEKKTEKEEKDKKHHLFECSYGSFTRSFSLPAQVKADKIEAVFSEGILKLTVPKAEESKPRQIDIKIK